MEYEQALAYMQSLHRYGVKLGNERFRELLRRLGDPHRRFPVAHVAGTKGKGSTTVMSVRYLDLLWGSCRRLSVEYARDTYS